MQSSGFEGVRRRRQVGRDTSQAHEKEQLVSMEVPGGAWDRFVSYLTAPTDPSNLAILRIMYGLLMVIDIPQERGMASIFYRWEEGACIFPLFNSLRPLSTEWMYMVYMVMFLGALGILLGFMYRLSCLFFVVTYWYIFFLDKTVWNNHSYLYGLISVMLLLCDANRYWSVDALLNPKIRNAHIPRWNYVLLRFQIFIVYFFAGLKKIDMDWMTGYSMTGLSRKWVFAPFVSIFGEDFVDLWMVHVGGLAFDLTEGFLLAWDKTRVIGTVLGLMFHGMNSQMFHIGMFPYAMIATMPLFYATDWPKKLMSKFPSWMQYVLPSTEDAKSSCHCVYSAMVADEKVKDKREAKNAPERSSKPRVLHHTAVCVALAYIAVQSALPYSHFITKGYNAWTEGLYGYSWDMMIHSWSTQHVRIKVVDNATGEVIFIRPGAFIAGSDQRHSRWNSHPDMIKQYTTCLAEHLKVHDGLNITEPAIYLDVWRSMNRRFQQRLVDPNVDLVSVTWSPFKHSPWIKPLLLELSPWRKKLNEITTALDEKSNFTDVVFVADFPGLMLENFVDPELNASITVLNGKVNIEVNSTNITLGVDDELYVPSNDTHMVYTVSDTPSCWMYVYTNMTILNNETLRNWVLHPETIPKGNTSARQYKNMTRWQKLQFFVLGKYALFASSFANTFYSGRYLIFGTRPPYHEVEEGAYDTSTTTGSDPETQTGSVNKDKEGSSDNTNAPSEDSASTGRDSEPKTEKEAVSDTGNTAPENSAGVES